MNIKISLICTIKNEEKTIHSFLKSLENQTRKPDEIIIVDGGSTDSSIEIINKFDKKELNIKLLEFPGKNISEGRNIAIKNAKFDYIASIDAGCRADARWLELMTKHFETNKNIDVVSGWYNPVIKSKFQEILSCFALPELENILKNEKKFLPSSRSIAFKKKCWLKVGGYPEELQTAEDTVFDLNLKKMGCNFIFEKEAIVNWEFWDSRRSYFLNLKRYSFGDGQAFIFKFDFIVVLFVYIFLSFFLIMSVYWSPAIIFFLSTIFLHFILPSLVFFKKVKEIKVIYHLPILIFLKDLAICLGYYRGILNRILKKT